MKYIDLVSQLKKNNLIIFYSGCNSNSSFLKFGDLKDCIENVPSFNFNHFPKISIPFGRDGISRIIIPE